MRRLGNSGANEQIHRRLRNALTEFIEETAQLVPNDTDHSWDVYMLDRNTGTIDLISVSTTGTGSNGRSKSSNESDASGNFRLMTSAVAA